MLRITNATREAFAQRERQDEFTFFCQWWRNLASELPPLGLSLAGEVWNASRERGLELGIADDRDRRISLLSAAFLLHPSMDAATLLRVIDLIFAEDHDLVRLRAIKRAILASPMSV